MRDVNYKRYGDLYEIDETGRVWSKPRTVVKSDGVVQHRTRRELSRNKNSDGYPTVKLSVDGKSERVAVHRLVALTFIPNSNNFPEVNHKDFDRMNPSVDNLEWSSHKENVKYSHGAGRYEKPQFLRSGNPKARRVEMVGSKVFDCIADCAEDLIKAGYTSGSIQNATSQIIKVCNGTLRHYLGFRFRYA